jgi:hypothetical protein
MSSFGSSATTKPGRSGSWSLGELAQELDKRQVGPGGRFDPVGLGLGDGDRSAADGRSERWLELPEARLLLDHAAQVVLVEVRMSGNGAASAKRVETALGGAYGAQTRPRRGTADPELIDTGAA